MPLSVDNKSRFVTFNESSNGSIVALLIGLFIAFPAGYYYKYKSVRAHSLAVVEQAKLNERLDKILKDKQTIRRLSLKENLKLIGLSDREIDLLYKKDGRASKLKNKFTRYLPSKTIYIPRDDCTDDYLGDEATNVGNDFILEGNSNRISNQ